MEANVHISVEDICGSTTKLNSDILDCDICELSHIHKNDYENHIKSRGHCKKLREKDREHDKKSDEKFECLHCKRKFRGEEFYKGHLGSKTHKRNLRKLGLKVDVKPVAAKSGTVAQENEKRISRRLRRLPTRDNINLQIDSSRQKYKKRLEKIEDINYKTYVNSLTAYLSVRLALNQDIENFKISVNDRAWGMFGDVVIQISYKERIVLFAIQCKKVTQAFRQIDHLADMKLDVTKQYQYIAQLRNAGRDVYDTNFVIFTTCSTTSNFGQSVTLKSAVLKNWTSSEEEICLDATLKVKAMAKRNEILNVTNDPENTYSFTLSENGDYHLPHLFLFTNQRIFPATMNQLLSNKFDRYPDISPQYRKYIENWVDGRLGGNYKLKKKDVILKIGEILLSPYMVTPKKVHSKHDSFAIWNQIIDKVDVTMVRNEPFTISKVCQPLNMMIEETLSINIDTITKSINMKKQTFDNIVEPIKSYFFEVAHGRLHEDIPLHLVYNIFWKAGRIPLLLSTENEEIAKGLILDVILFMKELGVHKKFLIKTGDRNIGRFKTKQNLKIFTCLEDVKDFINWNEVQIRVSDSLQLTLDMIQSSDPFFFKWVTPNIFFDMSVGRYSFKPNNSAKKIQNKEDVLKIILGDSVKNTLENHLYPQNDSDYRNFTDTRLRGIDPKIL